MSQIDSSIQAIIAKRNAALDDIQTAYAQLNGKKQAIIADAPGPSPDDAAMTQIHTLDAGMLALLDARARLMLETAQALNTSPSLLKTIGDLNGITQTLKDKQKAISESVADFQAFGQVLQRIGELVKLAVSLAAVLA